MHHNLAEVQELIRSGRAWVARSTAVDMVQQVLQCTPGEAERFCKKAVLHLGEEDFSDVVGMDTGEADVYAKVIGGYPWYVKVIIDEDGEAGIVSCHLPHADVETKGGTVRCTTRPGRAL